MMDRGICISPSDKILVVAPHPDDESIGVGGLLAKYGNQCDILLLTDGRKGVSPKEDRPPETIAALRKAEFDCAISYFCPNKIMDLNLEDQGVYKNRHQIDSCSIKEYRYVFVPNRHDGHMDHKVLCKIFNKMKAKQRAKAEIVEYEVWSALSKPNLFLDISDVMDRKLKAVGAYASQLESYDYLSLCKGINQYRGAIGHVTYCEAYYSEQKADQRRREKRKMALWQKLPSGLRNAIKKIRS